MALLQNVIGRGTHAARPAAGSQGVIWFETDTGQCFRDSGAVWQLIDLSSLFATKGDLLVGTGAGTVAKLAAGTDAYILTADSTQTDGIKWAAAGSGAMAQLYDSTLGSAAASFATGTLSAAYQHLKIVAQLRLSDAATAAYVGVRVNGDTGSNYDSELVYASATGITALETIGATSWRVVEAVGASGTANCAASVEITIPNYNGTTFFKNFHAHGSDARANSTGSVYALHGGGIWRSTAAVTSLTLIDQSGGNFVTGSRLTVYGWN